MPKLRKYKDEIVIAEADLLLAGHKLQSISTMLKVPISTVSWHLIYPLFFIDYNKWVKVRKIMNKYAKDELRVYNEYLYVKAHTKPQEG